MKIADSQFKKAPTLETCEIEQAKWRAIRDEQPTWNRAKRDADDWVEFWSNKAAFLSVPKPAR